MGCGSSNSLPDVAKAYQIEIEMVSPSTFLKLRSAKPQPETRWELYMFLLRELSEVWQVASFNSMLASLAPAEIVQAIDWIGPDSLTDVVPPSFARQNFPDDVWLHYKSVIANIASNSVSAVSPDVSPREFKAPCAESQNVPQPTASDASCVHNIVHIQTVEDGWLVTRRQCTSCGTKLHVTRDSLL